MAENDKFEELSSASQKAADAERIALANQDLDILKESADLQKQIVFTLKEELLLIDQIKDGKKSLTDLTKFESDKAELLLKAKQNQNILDKTKGEAAGRQSKQMDSVLSSVDKIKGITEKDVGLNKVKNSLMGKAELNMKSLSGLTGGLAPKALEFAKALRANPMIMIASAVIGLTKMLLNVNQEITEIGRGLGVSANEARNVRANFVAIQGASSNVLNTTAEIAKAQSTLNQALGTSATMISGRILDGMATLQNRMGLTAESAVGFAQSAMISGKSVRELTHDAVGAAAAVEKERGTRLDIKQILKDTGKVTGQIRAQLGGSVEAIASAVSKAKSLGMELKDVAAAGKQLLNFEQSISAELEAELLTGKQLNLERARLAALTGDYSTLTEEINANVGDFYEFSKLNVLQQQSLAKAVGMEADQLADILMKKENIAELTERARLEGREDLVQNLEQLSVQEKFNAAIEKLKVAVVNLVAKLEGSSLISALFSGISFTLDEGAQAVGGVGAGKEADIEGAVERGLSKAKINVSTRYDSFNANSPSYINGRTMSNTRNNNSFA